MLMMEAQTARSLLGNVRNLLYRNLPTFLEVTHGSGRTRHWRTVRLNLSSGVIVQPLPSSQEELACFFRTPQIVTDPVKSLRFIAASPGEFRPEILIRWSRVLIEEAIIDGSGGR